METELTRWNDVPPWMATNDVCCCLLWFVCVDRLVGVFHLCDGVCGLLCGGLVVCTMDCVLYTVNRVVWLRCDLIRCDATRCDGMGYDPMGNDTVGHASVRLVGTGTLSVDVWCVVVGARTWRGCWSMISASKYACVSSVNEW